MTVDAEVPGSAALFRELLRNGVAQEAFVRLCRDSRFTRTRLPSPPGYRRSGFDPSPPDWRLGSGTERLGYRGALSWRYSRRTMTLCPRIPCVCSVVLGVTSDKALDEEYVCVEVKKEVSSPGTLRVRTGVARTRSVVLFEWCQQCASLDRCLKLTGR